MKALTLLNLALAVAAASAADVNLRYEWSASPAGPFVAVPAENIKLNADGSASVISSGQTVFFRLLINGGADGGGTSVPVLTYDSLPATTKLAVNELFKAVRGDRSEEAADWDGAQLPAFVTPVFSAWNTTGKPDSVEIKITAPCAAAPGGGIFKGTEGTARSSDRGFIMAGISRKVPPVVGYRTGGITPTEELLRSCDAGKVRSIVRFGPAFLAALDADGELLGNRGLLPGVYPDQAYRDRSGPVSRTWDTERTDNPRMPDPPAAALPRAFPKFRDLLEAYRATPFLNERRRQMESLIEFDWQSLENRAPVLSVKVGEQSSFLDGETFTRYWLDDEERPGGVEVRLGARGEGIIVRQGKEPSAFRLTLLDNRGALSRYLIQVRSAVAPRGNNAPAWVTTSTLWEAGTSAQQPRYSQRSDLGRWCDPVGCGPVMLAMMIAWAERNQNVPSAFWDRTPSGGAAMRNSLRGFDSAMRYDNYESDDSFHTMRDWYDWLHDECDVACWDWDAGSSLPENVGSTLEDYLSYARSPLFLPAQAGDGSDPLTGYVKGFKHWENDGWGDDWDEAGIRVANAIKAGRPGGVYYMEHWHYAMAWRYRKTIYELKTGDYVIQQKIARHFRVNMGWGAGEGQDEVWNAYDIDGCYLLNISQRRLPPP